MVEHRGARRPDELAHVPPYSPDINPIELCWSKLKGLLREFGVRTRDALDVAIRRAMDLVD